MKNKSKLTGTLAVGGGLKHAVVPYIITGEENNGYSKGDILDANYVKLLINNNTIPDDIQANTLTLNSGQIFTNGGFSVFDKALNTYPISCLGGATIFKAYDGSNYIVANGNIFMVNSSEIHIGDNSNLFASLNLAIINIGGEDIILSNDVWQFPTGVLRFDKSKESIEIGNSSGGNNISIGNHNITINAATIRMGNHIGPVLLYYSNKDSSSFDFDGDDPVIIWDQSILKMNKIYKPTQTISEKDLFERVSNLETPKTIREANPKVGQCVFDTTLGKPIWCKTAKTGTTAAVWVDATGATV